MNHNPSHELITQCLPHWDVAARYAVPVGATKEALYPCIRKADLSVSYIVRALFAARSLPALLSFRPQRSLPLTLEGLLQSGFILLAENPPHELVLGLIGQFWRPSGGICRLQQSEFAAFASPGYAKAVWNFALTEKPTYTLLSTETRVFCTDARSRRRFMRYWFVIRPFSGLIRKEALRIIQRNAERL